MQPLKLPSKILILTKSFSFVRRSYRKGLEPKQLVESRETFGKSFLNKLILTNV